jgi:hypothetical protein
LANRFVPWLEESLVFEGYFVFLTNALIRNQENLMETIHINVFYYVYNVSYIYISTHTHSETLENPHDFPHDFRHFYESVKDVCTYNIYIYSDPTQTPTHIYIYINK